jgi:hypothetical protein
MAFIKKRSINVDNFIIFMFKIGFLINIISITYVYLIDMNFLFFYFFNIGFKYLLSMSNYKGFFCTNGEKILI